jgi:hypothetical protein
MVVGFSLAIEPSDPEIVKLGTIEIFFGAIYYEQFFEQNRGRSILSVTSSEPEAANYQ